ncbi:MAG: glucose 1-dehydrogenase [Acidobacteriota bacterium]
MKAVGVFPVERRYEVIDHPEPAIGNGAAGAQQVKLRILEVGICGTDKEIVAFEYGNPPEGSHYLILGHESLGEVVEVGSGVTNLKPGDLAVPTVRRPCSVASCIACRNGRQDFCFTGGFTERGINGKHGFMAEYVVEDAMNINPVPRGIRDVAVLVEPLTIAEKGMAQLWTVQQRLPWTQNEPGQPRGHGLRAVVLGGGPVGLLGAMKLILEGFDTYIYSLSPPGSDLPGMAAGFGAKFVPAETTSVAQLAELVGNVDVVYEATGVSSLSYEVMKYLGTNGAFIFTGVPALKGPKSIDADLIMRNITLKNQVIIGTVNANKQAFADAISDLGQFHQRWPNAVGSLITARFPIDDVKEPLSGKVGGIKSILTVAAVA